MNVFDPKKNYVLLGETGSGKSELAVNLALSMAEEGHSVNLYDLDQSKPLFRARDLEQTLQAKGVKLYYGKQLLDSPVIAANVRMGLRKQDCCAILDVGGGENAARVVGSFRAEVEKSDTEVLYVLNPFRPYSTTVEDIDLTLTTILSHCRLNRYTLVLSPHVGHTTTVEEVVKGYQRLKAMLPPEVAPLCLCANAPLCPDLAQQVDVPLVPLDLQFTYTWSENDG